MKLVFPLEYLIFHNFSNGWGNEITIENEKKQCLLHVLSLFRSPLLRVARALSSAKPRKSSQTKRAPYLSLAIIMEIQYILLLVEILINAGFIKRGQSVNIIFSRSWMQS